MLRRIASTWARSRFLVCPRPRVHIGRMADALTFTLNGETRNYPPPLSVASLLGLIGLDTRKVAVELNEEIVPRSAYAATWLRQGDQLEIVHFIGGG
jgi:thiazole synthase/sulfur carrier protein